MKMKVTVVGYYVADPHDYDGETDPVKMAGIDFDNIAHDAYMAVALMDGDLPTEITVQPDA